MLAPSSSSSPPSPRFGGVISRRLRWGAARSQSPSAVVVEQNNHGKVAGALRCRAEYYCERDGASETTPSTASTDDFCSDEEEDYELVRSTASSSDCPASKGCLRVKSQEESLGRKYAQSPASTEGAASASAFTSTTKKRVGFSQITISVHGVLLGDNPSVSCGPPLSIDWECFETARFGVDEYERVQPPTARRTRAELRIPASVRELWLRRSGEYARSELVDSVREVRRVQRQRANTARRQVRKLYPSTAGGCKATFLNALFGRS